MEFTMDEKKNSLPGQALAAGRFRLRQGNRPDYVTSKTVVPFYLDQMDGTNADET